MNRTKQHVFTIIILVALLFSQSGCLFSDRGSRLPDFVINSPAELQPNLVDIQLFFSKTNENISSGHLTNLDRQEQIDFSLEIGGRHLKISNDKNKVVYSLVETVNEEFRSSIWLLDLNSGIKQRVILWPDKLTDTSLVNPNFFPDGKKLIFSITWPGTDTIGIGSVDLDGNNLEVINTPNKTFSEGPIVSPDGEKILVLCEGVDQDSGKPGFMLCIMDKDGSHRRRLMKDGNYHGTYLFTPDSESIIYSEAEWGGLFGLVNKSRYQINSISVEGKNQRTILVWHRAINVLALNDDGSEIIFMDRPENGKTSSLYIINQDGSNLRHLAYFDDFLADWYPME